MNFRLIRLWLILLCLLAFPFRSPAPLIYQPGEGWTYEPVGGQGKWQRRSAREQIEVAQAAFDKKDYSLAAKAARYTVKTWPLSDYAPDAQYLVGRCYEARGNDEKAFKEYQKLLEKNPKFSRYDETVGRQYEIARKFLNGKRYRFLGYIPLYRSWDKTSGLYEKIVKNGPYNDIAPKAQMDIGTAREKQKNYPLAAKAYEVAADRYHDRPKIASDALYRQGLAYQKQAQTAEYDQNTAGQAISTFTDFITLYPQDKRVDAAEKTIAELKLEQARGSFEIAKFYEKRRKWDGALVYYNEVQRLDPGSSYGADALKRIDEIKKTRKTNPK